MASQTITKCSAQNVSFSSQRSVQNLPEYGIFWDFWPMKIAIIPKVFLAYLNPFNFRLPPVYFCPFQTNQLVHTKFPNSLPSNFNPAGTCSTEFFYLPNHVTYIIIHNFPIKIIHLHVWRKNKLFVTKIEINLNDGPKSQVSWWFNVLVSWHRTK